MSQATRTSIICESHLHASSQAHSGFAFFGFLVSLRDELRNRKHTITRATPNRGQLPRYVERNRNGTSSFRVDQGVRTRLPNDPTTPDFRTAYSAALVEAIAREDDSDDWSELEAMHRAQRRGTAKHGGQR
jgi:hypothetical protein